MGYFDIQVNGYGGINFNQDNLSLRDLRSACQKLRESGVDQILATIVTDSPERMESRISKIAEHRDADCFIADVVEGIHIEGPFLNPLEGYRGAHPLEAIRAADVGLMRGLLSAGSGLVRLVTLAPEQDAGGKVIRFLRDSNITVSAGHTNASLEQLQDAIVSGLSMFTHLGNGCPASLPRHDNIVQRALFLRDLLWLCFIADGIHIPLFALRNYLELARLDRCIVTTDAIAVAGLGPGRFALNHQEVEVSKDLAVWEPGGAHFLGSAVSMALVERNLKSKLCLTQKQCSLLLDKNPREAIDMIG